MKSYLSSTMMNRVGTQFKFLTFDAMGTIVRLLESPADVYSRFANDRFGIYLDRAKLREEFKSGMIFKEMDCREPCYSFHNGKGADHWWRGVVRMVVGKYSESPSDESKIRQLADDLFKYYTTAEPWTITEPNLINSLRRFRQRRPDVKIAIISNFDSRLRTVLAAFDFPPIDTWLLSGECGMAKPDAAIFRRALSCLGSSAAVDAMHVGDDLKRDYLAALAAGMQARLYAPKCAAPANVPEKATMSSLSQFLDNCSRAE